MHRGQGRDEQLGDTDHVVVAEHGDIVGDFQAAAEQQLIGTKGNTVVATDQDVELRATVEDVPVEDGCGFTIGVMIGKVLLQQ